MPLDDATYVEHDVIPDILRRARRLVADNWVQCPNWRAAGEGHCIVGAVGATLRAMERETGRPLMGLFDATLDRLCAALPGSNNAMALSLTLYNDAEGRTLDDILKVFDGAMVSNEMPSLRQW